MKEATATPVTVLLPEGPLFEEIYRSAIEPACRQAGQACSRLPARFSSGEAWQQLTRRLAQAQWVLAEVSGRNPNVMYQVGYAHALGKPVLLLTQHGEDFSFATERHPTIIYGGNLEFLRKELVQQLGRGVGLAATAAASGPADAAREKFLALFEDLLKEHHYQVGQVEQEGEKIFILKEQEMSLVLVEALVRRGREQGIRLKLM